MNSGAHLQKFSIISFRPKEEPGYVTKCSDRGSIPRRGRDFSLRHSVQTGPEAHTASYQMRAGSSPFRNKAAVTEADHLPSAEVKNTWSYTTTPLYVLMAWCFVKHGIRLHGGREADHSPPSSAEGKNAWIHTSTPQYVFMAWCLVKNRDSFAFFTCEVRFHISETF
jgi:hypothetical protein